MGEIEGYRMLSRTSGNQHERGTPSRNKTTGYLLQATLTPSLINVFVNPIVFCASARVRLIDVLLRSNSA